MADTILPRDLVERAPTLYSITGDIKDINTLLIPRSALTQQAEGAPEYFQRPERGTNKYQRGVHGLIRAATLKEPS